MVRVIQSDLGAIVKAYRNKKGLTQEKLAERAGVGLRHVSGIENEGNYPSYDVLYKIIRELNINTDEVFFPETHAGNTNLEYLVRLLGRCNERDILAITALVEVILRNPDEM